MRGLVRSTTLSPVCCSAGCCIIAALVAVMLPGTVRAAAPCQAAAPSSFEIAPDRVVPLRIAPDANVLIEEIGADVEYRRGDDATFTAIDTPPGRLGFAVLRPGAAQLELRIKSGQGAGRVRVRNCIDAGDASFYEQLAQFQQTHLRAGADAARNALSLIESLQWLPQGDEKRSWIAGARANALLSAGRIGDSIDAFAQARTQWEAAGRPDRAAVALMAQGESASRAGRFDDAERLLALAEAELLRNGVTYYGLRSRGALCTVQSRRGNFEASIACEVRVLDAMQQAGEQIEAATRRISLANQYMRLGDFPRSRDLLLAADRNAQQMSAVVRSRLDSTWGSYFLYNGDLPTGAARFARAAAALGEQGLPGDQGLIDLKLASLAALSGARVERRRLLERVAARLDAKDASPLLADSRLQLARSARDIGEPLAAVTFAQAARELCSGIGDRECIAASRVVEAQALIDLGKLESAETLLAAIPASDASLTRIEAALASVRLQLALGRPTIARQRLPDARTFADDLNLQAQHARLKAAVLVALGNRTDALAAVGDMFTRQLHQAETWPSAALRVSARNRLSELQGTLFGLLLASATGTIDARDFDRVVLAIDDGSVHRLFREPSGNHLDDALRRALSGAVLTGTSDRQRELFVALTQAPGSVAVANTSTTSPRTEAALEERDLVAIPLQTDTEFLMVVWRAGSPRLCRRWPLQQYLDLVAQYERALDGQAVDARALDAAALDWHAAVESCHAGMPPSSRWTIVSVPGSRRLPWAWIASAAAGHEPLVSTTFRVPHRQPDTAMQAAPVTLVDLNMPNNGNLPFASRERVVLEELFGKKKIPLRFVAGADDTSAGVLATLSANPIVHVIGHGNPAAYGQLYQGLWFESQRQATLLTYPEIAATPSRADLVVLSSCGTTVAGQAAFGATSNLAEAFIAAGARRVVAASNALSDAAAPIWSRAFHDSLSLSGDVAVAARDARRALRASPYFRPPRYWAGIEVYLSVDLPMQDMTVVSRH